MKYLIGEHLQILDGYRAHTKNTVCTFTFEQWQKSGFSGCEEAVPPKPELIRACRAESYHDYFCGCLAIPVKDKFMEKYHMAFVLQKQCLAFVDDSGYTAGFIEKVRDVKTWSDPSVISFLASFFEYAVEEDLPYLEKLDTKLSTLENSALKGRFKNFDAAMLRIRRELLMFYRYYEQLLDVMQALTENENKFFAAENMRPLDLCAARIRRLTLNVQALREYSMQVREVYQGQIGINQNKTMKTLTLVTTIFLPLTLMTGWYGMNFVHMPELKWKFGYALVIAVAAVIVALCLIWFKHKNYFDD